MDYELYLGCITYHLPMARVIYGFTFRVARFYLFQYRTSYNFNSLHHQYPFDNNSIMVLRFQDWKLDLRMDVEAIRQPLLFGLDLWPTSPPKMTLKFVIPFKIVKRNAIQYFLHVYYNIVNTKYDTELFLCSKYKANISWFFEGYVGTMSWLFS